MPDPSRVPIRPLQVSYQRIGQFQHASSVADLAGMLLSDKWRGKRGAKHRRAMVTCLEALEAGDDGEKARKAFIVAAHDAGMTVLPDDGLQAAS